MSALQSPAPGNPLTYFSAERSLLAWIRTGLAMMGFGFVVARFGLFLRELAAVRGVAVPQQTGVSLYAGTALVLLGVVVNVLAAARYWRIVRQLDRNEPLRFRLPSLGVVTALLLALFGLTIAAYLIFALRQQL